MWLSIALPLVLIMVCIINLYLRKDEIFKQEKVKDMLKEFIPREIKYISFLVAAFLVGLAAYYTTYSNFNDYVRAIKFAVIILLIFPAAYIDYKKHIIPNVIILAGFFLRVLIYILELTTDVNLLLDTAKSDFFGILFGGGIFLLSAIISKNSVGMGDVKLFAVIGIFCGFQGAFGAVFFTLLVSFIASIGLIISRKKTRKDTIAFAPFALIGTLIMILLGSN